jgi:hypothetical protein
MVMLPESLIFFSVPVSSWAVAGTDKKADASNPAVNVESVENFMGDTPRFG